MSSVHRARRGAANGLPPFPREAATRVPDNRVRRHRLKAARVNR
jgi:hypothetical protein